VKDDEVPAALVLFCEHRIILVYLALVEAAVREQPHELEDAGLNEVKLVDSSGSMKPLDRPMATQFFSHSRSRRPASKRSHPFGGAPADDHYLADRLARSLPDHAAAAPSDPKPRVRAYSTSCLFVGRLAIANCPWRCISAKAARASS
jgi:hypothetical protein